MYCKLFLSYWLFSKFFSFVYNNMLPGNYQLFKELWFVGFICSALISISFSQSCGRQLQGSEGTVSHPEYPDDYTADADCEWTLTAKNEDEVFFKFELLNIEADRQGGCTYDYVSIQFPAESSPEKFCGLPNTRDPNQEFTKEGRGNPTIKFITDDSVQHPGFLLNYRIERFDYCKSGPCKNGATCSLDEDTEDGWRCDCTSGWSGKTCNEDFDECQSDPCQNGGNCSTPDFGEYLCTCAGGFTGKQCETNIDECNSTPCRNGGTCVDATNSYTCQCVLGFTGRQCETNIDECQSNPCQNNGGCVDEVAAYRCDCRNGFEGRRCEIDVDECASDPCANGGTCTDQVNRFKCTCAEGFEGLMCTNDVDECLSEPCQNGGTCLNRIKSYKCNCADGFTDDTCSVDIDECTSRPCQNGGSCTDHPGHYECECINGYSGTNCETAPSNDPTESSPRSCNPNPCLNGGRCVEDEPNFFCQCLENYIGKTCDSKINDKEKESMSSSFFILLLLLLAVVGVAGFVYWLMKRKKKHKHRVQSVRTIQVKPNERRRKDKNLRKTTAISKESKELKKIRKKLRKPKKYKKDNYSSVESDTDIVSLNEMDLNKNKESTIVIGKILPTEPNHAIVSVAPTFCVPPSSFEAPMFSNSAPIISNYPQQTQARSHPTNNPIYGNQYQHRMQPGMFYSTENPRLPHQVYQNSFSYPVPTNPVHPYPYYNDIHRNRHHMSSEASSEDESSGESSMVTPLPKYVKTRKKKHLPSSPDHRERPRMMTSTPRDHEDSYETSFYNERNTEIPRSYFLQSPEEDPQESRSYDKLQSSPRRRENFQNEGDHWQERDNRESNWIPPTHKYYQLDDDVDPEIIHALKKAGQLKETNSRPRYYQNTNPPKKSSGKFNPMSHLSKKGDYQASKNQTTENLANIQRQPTFIPSKKSILSTGLSSIGFRKPADKRVNFSDHVNRLTPIKEEPWTGDFNQQSKKSARNSLKLTRPHLNSERHPPDGGISSSEEFLERKLRRSSDRWKKRNGEDRQKEESKLNLIKLIRRTGTSINVNRGRGFSRENAFIK